jgi:hypothetical protein
MAVQRSTFLDPLWRRVAIVAFCAIWSAFEFWNGEAFWGVIAGGMGVYGAWMYLYDYGREAPPAPAPKQDEDNP